MIPTVLPHSTVLAQRRPDPRGPSSRVRLTVEALEALLAVPDRFQRIDFGDGKGHLFKKSVHSDKTRFPNGEFFAAKINEQGNFDQENHYSLFQNDSFKSKIGKFNSKNSENLKFCAKIINL